jgi:PleD family two-component response regulator
MGIMGNGRMKVFLVDDVEYSLVRTKQHLKDNFTVYSLDSSPKMFELLKKVEPDVILMDINMPVIDGYEAIKLLKADEQYAEIPVIFLSANDDEESIIKGISLGAADYVSKPYSPQDLIDRITNCFYSNKHQDELQIDIDKNVSKLSIIAVDDSPSMLRSIHFALNNHYKIHTLQRPEKLKDVIHKLNPDLLLLDFNMPVVNGLELVKIVREFPEFKETPIIFLTSESSPIILTEAIKLGISDYIVKPFNPKKLREKIAKKLARKD